MAMSKKSTNTKTKEESKARFTAMLREYENACVDMHAEQFGTALLALSASVTNSVVRKCADTSYSEAIAKVRREVVADLANVLNVREVNSTDTSKDADSKLYSLIHNPLGDGLDLVHDAVVKLLEETAKADTAKPYFLETRRTERVLSKRVFIKEADSKAYKDVETYALREAFRTVRRSVSGHRTIEASDGKYTYLEAVIFDENGNEIEDVYKRLPMYADLGGTVRDFNGVEVAYTANEADLATVEELMQKMNLTPRQEVVLNFRLSGYGHKAIATYLGVSKDSVRDTVSQLKKKAIAIGMTPEKAS